MAEKIEINNTFTDEEKYNQLLPQIDSIISADEPIVSGLTNLTAILKETFSKISWIGFYIAVKDKLFLGPFQGNLACVQIKIGNGVCGTAADKKETIIVKDVDKFPGHIACDAGSKSEIVLPIIQDDILWGVLDLDSYEYSSFNEIDKKYLNKILDIIKLKFDLNRFKIN